MLLFFTQKEKKYVYETLIIFSEGRQKHDGRRTAQVTGFESLPQEEVELDLDDAQFLDLNQTGKEETILSHFP